MNRRGWLKTIGAAVVGCLVPFKFKKSNTYGYSKPFPRITLGQFRRTQRALRLKGCPLG